MIECSSDVDFAEEAFRPQAGREVGMKDLHGHGALVPEISREIHRSHSAASQLAFEPVRLSDGSLKPGLEI